MPESGHWLRLKLTAPEQLAISQWQEEKGNKWGMEKGTQEMGRTNY